MAVFKHGNEGTFFQKENFFFRKAWFLAQFHGDSEGAFSVSSFFQRNSGGFCRFSDCIWGGKKNPKNSGAFCLFQMNRWRGQFFVRGIPQKFFGVFVSYRTWWWGDFFEIKKLCLGPALYVKQFLLANNLQTICEFEKSPLTYTLQNAKKPRIFLERLSKKPSHWKVRNKSFSHTLQKSPSIYPFKNGHLPRNSFGKFSKKFSHLYGLNLTIITHASKSPLIYSLKIGKNPRNFFEKIPVQKMSSHIQPEKWPFAPKKDQQKLLHI